MPALRSQTADRSRDDMPGQAVRPPALTWPEPQWPNRSQKTLRLIRLPSVPFLGAFLIRDREKAPTPAPDHRALIKRPDDLRRLRVHQARAVELPVRVVPVAPAVGEPLAEPGARHLTAQLGPEAAAGVPRAGRHRALEVAQLRLHIGLQGAGESGDELHGRPACCERAMLVVERPILTGARSPPLDG
jgi:hypothetical protein